MGLQSLPRDEGNWSVDVHGFKGTDSEGIPWQTFFDVKTKSPIMGFSGDGDTAGEGATRIEF